MPKLGNLKRRIADVTQPLLSKLAEATRRVRGTTSARLAIAVFSLIAILIGVQVWANVHLSRRALAVSEALSNGDIAKAFADKLRGMGRAETGSALYQHIREIAAFNPAVRLYLVNDHGIVKASPDAYGKLLLPFVDIRSIKRALARDGKGDVVYGDDPHNLRKQQPLSVSPIKIDGQQHYVYVVLGDGGVTDAFSRTVGRTIGFGTFALSVLSVALVVGIGFVFMYWRLHGINSSIAAISHDLRGPLTSVQGYLETLLERGDKIDQKSSKRYMKVALKSTQSAATLVNDLHHLAKLDASGEQLQMEPFSLADLVMDIAMSADPAFRQKEVSISLDAPPGIPLVEGDLALIERLLRNLIDNSLRYTAPKGRVEITLAPVKNRVRFTITDTGCGIPEDELGKIGQQFYRGQQTKSATTGSGLGLSIAHRIVQAHGGELRVLSREREGTAVIFELKAVSKAASAARKAPRQSHTGH